MIYQGFPPLFDGQSKVLILGSFPSVKSRQTQFYYGNAQNRFWKTLCEFFGETVQSIDDKKALCLRHNVALWDIVKSCEIKGSMDVDIKNFELVDLGEVLSKSAITKILCNGAKAYELTVKSFDALPVVKMPSTSPANVSFDKQKWFDELTKLSLS